MFFFFQAEDGIRDGTVTGVQTCALPISLQLAVEVRRDGQTSVAARDPWTLFRHDQPWRPNPPIDEGHYTTLSGTVTFDTRNDRTDPTAGWLLSARLESSRSQDVSPQTGVPTTVRRAIPTDGSYKFTRAFFDLRRYTRVSPSGRVNLRLLAGGGLGGDWGGFGLYVAKAVTAGEPLRFTLRLDHRF